MWSPLMFSLILYAILGRKNHSNLGALPSICFLHFSFSPFSFYKLLVLGLVYTYLVFGWTNTGEFRLEMNLTFFGGIISTIRFQNWRSNPLCQYNVGPSSRWGNSCDNNTYIICEWEEVASTTNKKYNP